jgi:hypothetical protein
MDLFCRTVCTQSTPSPHNFRRASSRTKIPAATHTHTVALCTLPAPPPRLFHTLFSHPRIKTQLIHNGGAFQLGYVPRMVNCNLLQMPAAAAMLRLFLVCNSVHRAFCGSKTCTIALLWSATRSASAPPAHLVPVPRAPNFTSSRICSLTQCCMTRQTTLWCRPPS